MLHRILKAGAALALGSFAFGGHALAVTSPAINAAPLVILAQDEENEEVWKDLRPDITPPPAAVGEQPETPKGTPHEGHEKEGASGDVEQKEFKEDRLEGE